MGCRPRGWAGTFLLLCLGLALGTGPVLGWGSDDLARQLFWSYMQPPPDHVDRFGDYRSPLLFRDGSVVETRADWERRRAELRAEWMETLGPWPARDWLPQWTVLGATNRLGIPHFLVRLEVARGQFNDGWLLVPPGTGRRPAAVVVGVDADEGIGLLPTRFGLGHALRLATLGFVTLSLGVPGGDPHHPDLGGAECQPQSYLACVADHAARVLGRLPEVDPARIGVVGHGYGGRWAVFAGALSDRFALVVASAPCLAFDESCEEAAYWEPWSLGREGGGSFRRRGPPAPGAPRAGAYRRLVADAHDAHELVALIAPRPFFLIGGVDDPVHRWTLLNHGRLVNQLLGYSGRIAFNPRPFSEPEFAHLWHAGDFFLAHLKAVAPRPPASTDGR